MPETGEPGSTVISCPLDVCPWTYMIPPLPDLSRAATISVALGAHPLMLAQQAEWDRMQKTEAALADHLATHTVVQFVAQITALRGEARRWKDCVEEQRKALTAHVRTVGQLQAENKFLRDERALAARSESEASS